MISHLLRKLGSSVLASLLLVLVANTSSAQEAPQRVFEIRTYTSTDGRLDDVVDRFRQDSMRLLARHGMESVGYWIPQDSTLSENTLIYILAHPDREAARAAWSRFFADPEWQQVRARTEANGPIIARVESVFVDPTDFSPIR